MHFTYQDDALIQLNKCLKQRKYIFLYIQQNNSTFPADLEPGLHSTQNKARAHGTEKYTKDETLNSQYKTQPSCSDRAVTILASIRVNKNAHKDDRASQD